MKSDYEQGFDVAYAKYIVKLEALQARIAELEAENERLKNRLETAGDDVMEIIAAALSGDCQKYLNFDMDGNKYCKWGIVSKDIKAVFGVTEPSDIEG